MSNGTRQDLITISREEVRKRGGVVILPLREYHKLRAQSVPTYQLTGKEAEALDKLVEEGLRDYRRGKTKKIRSLADLN